METMHACPANHNLTSTSTFNMPALKTKISIYPHIKPALEYMLFVSLFISNFIGAVLWIISLSIWSVYQSNLWAWFCISIYMTALCSDQKLHTCSDSIKSPYNYLSNVPRAIPALLSKLTLTCVGWLWIRLARSVRISAARIPKSV